VTPKLSDLDIPEIISAAAEWALASSQIEKISLYRFKPGRASTEDPSYAIIIWVPPDVDTTLVPWMEPLRNSKREIIGAQVRNDYRDPDGNRDKEKIFKHPLYDLWHLFGILSDFLQREYFSCFYREGYEPSDPRFDWLVLLSNIGDEADFLPGGTYDDLDNTELGSVVLFPQEAKVPQKNGEATQTSAQDHDHDHDSFIRSLKVSYVSDTEISIKAGGKNAKTYEKKELGFKKNNSKTWVAFIQILTSQDHFYRVGEARGAKKERKQSYDVGQKTLFEISRKMVSFFNKTYQIQLLEKYKVYELVPRKQEKPGTYRFKFQITQDGNADREGLEELSRGQLLSKIETLSEQCKMLCYRGDEEGEAKVEKIKNQLDSAIIIASKKGWLGENRAGGYLNPQDDPPTY